MLFLGASGLNRQLEFGFLDLEFNRWDCRAPSPGSLIESGTRRTRNDIRSCLCEEPRFIGATKQSRRGRR